MYLASRYFTSTCLGADLHYSMTTDHLPLSLAPKPAFPHWRQIACSTGLCCCQRISMTSSIGDPSSTVTQMDCPGCLSDKPPESSQADIFYFREVQSAPVTAAQVKRYTRTDPVLSEVLAWISHGKRGEMTDNFRPYLIRQNELTVRSGCLLALLPTLLGRYTPAPKNPFAKRTSCRPCRSSEDERDGTQLLLVAWH